MDTLPIFAPMTVAQLYRDATRSVAYSQLARFTYPWEALPCIGQMIRDIGRTLPDTLYDRAKEDVWIAKNATVAASASLCGPCIVCEGAEIRHCALIRGNAIIGKHAVVGNSTELKNCLLFDEVQVPHFNYVGDSILGYRSHLGAGAVTSNVKNDKSLIFIRFGDVRIPTGRKKVGAMLGDGVEVGCHAVLNPGTVIGPGTSVYPLSSVRGYVPADSILKSGTDIVPRRMPFDGSIPQL